MSPSDNIWTADKEELLWRGTFFCFFYFFFAVMSESRPKPVCTEISLSQMSQPEIIALYFVSGKQEANLSWDSLFLSWEHNCLWQHAWFLWCLFTVDIAEAKG